MSAAASQWVAPSDSRKQRIASERDSACEPPPGSEAWPVTPLGHRDGLYFYLSPAGELRQLSARDHNRLGILSLFDGDTGTLTREFTTHDKDGHASWSANVAAGDLMRACAAKGIFDALTCVRGPGVWRDGDHGVIVHAGDAVRLGDRWEAAGVVHGDAIYAAAARCQRPSAAPVDCHAGERLRDAIRLWRFESPVGAEIVLGFVGASMLGGAPAWRVHGLLTGPRGSGKSLLTDLVKAALGGGALDANDATEAGLRQMFTGRAQVLVLDESESDERGSGRVARVVNLLRLMSGGEGAKSMRGSAAGRAQSFTITGCAWLVAIVPPPLKPQDRSRLTAIKLRRLGSGAGAAGQAEKVISEIAAAAQASPGLRARAIVGWGRFLDTFAAYRAAFMARDCDARDADRIATLLAGRDLLLHDTVPDSDSLDEEVERFLELIEDAAEQEEEGEGQQCLTHLYTSTAELWREGGQRLVSEVILDALSLDPDAPRARRQLTKLGLRLKIDDRDRTNAILLVANQHVGLDRIFAGTRWAGGGWRAALSYLDGAAPHLPVRFAGVQQRAIAIPATWLPDEGEPEGEL